MPILSFRAVKSEADQNFDPGSQSPYIICQNYQRLASSIAKNPNAPPTTRVSEDGMSISYKEHTLHIPTWRAGLAKLISDVESELDELCGGEDFGLSVPAVVPDDWTNDTRGYSWVHNDPNHFGLPWGENHIPPLFLKVLKEGIIGSKIHGRFHRNKTAMTALLVKCDKLCEKIFLLVFFAVGQPPRVAEILDYKFANSTRGRNMFYHDGAIWFLNRRLKTESLTGKESSIASKASERVTKAIERYILLVRPFEKELIHHLTNEEDRQKTRQLYSEYLWIQSGVKMTLKDLYESIHTFLSGECNMDAGPRTYRQICVEIGRVYLGSEAEIHAEERNLLANQMGHSPELRRSHYASEVGHLPGMSSDLLLRYGRISGGWWEVIGFKTGTPPLEPLRIRQQLADAAAADAAAKRDEATESLLSIVESLRKEVKRLEARAGGAQREG